MLGDRTMATFEKFIIADLSGVLVHDRYQNYDSAELGRSRASIVYKSPPA